MASFENSGNVIGYVCKYTPVELLEAMGARCVAIEHVPDGVSEAEELCGTGICGFGKAVVTDVLSQGIRNLVLVDCCDTMRSVADVLAATGKLDFVHIVGMLHCDGSCARDLLAEELRHLASAWRERTGQSFDAERFRSSFGADETLASADEPHVSIIGARVEPDLLEMARRAIDIPVVDRTCLGNREAGRDIPPETDDFDELMSWYAGVLFGQMPCLRMADISTRRRLLDDPGLSGIIYHTVSFCDFYPLEYASIRGGVDIPMVMVESDWTRQSQGQITTRLDAFAETLSTSHAGARTCSADMEEDMADGNNSNPDGRFFAGIDSGSTSTDAVIIDAEGSIVAGVVIPTGAGATASAEDALAAAIERAGISKEKIAATIATGYGRQTVAGDGASITEISCHARGAAWLNPTVRTVIDIGGQDSKAIRIDEGGSVADFAMNDKCAAGTGRFIENISKALQMDISEMASRGVTCREEITISSTCAVFAESEVISLIAQDRDVDDIIHGINDSIAARTCTLVRRIAGHGPYMMTGGVAKNVGVVAALERRLGEKVLISEQSQLCGALGAALYARDSYRNPTQ